MGVTNPDNDVKKLSYDLTDYFRFMFFSEVTTHKWMTLVISIFCAALLLISSANAIVPAKYLGAELPLNATIASYNKLITSTRYRGNDLARLYWERARHYVELRRFRQANHDLSEAINLKPAYINAYLLRASVRASLQQYPEAFQDYDKVLQLDPSNLNVFKSRGIVNFVLGRYEDAIIDNKLYLRKRPDDLYRIIWLYLNERYNDRQADTTISRYITGLNLDLWPGAIIKLYLGDITFEELQNAFQTNQLNMNAGNACEAYFYLGQYFLLNNDRVSAKKYFAKAIKTQATDYIEYKLSLALIQKL